MGSSELLIILDRGGCSSLHQQVCDQISAMVASGRLRPGDPVPSSRELAQQLGVSRTVVMRAYQLLLARGTLYARRGSGTRVAEFAGGAPQTARGAAEAPLVPVPPRTTDSGNALWQPWEPPPMRERSVAIDFRHGTPALTEFPVARWRQSVHEAYSRADAVTLGYGPAEGSPALRAQIATLVRHSRALDASPDRILVTTGATQALDILVRLLAGPGDVVVIEDPSHTVLRQIFGCAGATVVPVRVDEEGLRVADIDERVRALGHDPARVRLVYVTPSHQFPTGVIMSEARRMALLAWAGERGATVLEDDYHNEFTFSHERLPALAASRLGSTVAYVGSFSKTLYPALRIGYAILPTPLVRPFLGIKWVTDRLTPTVTQEALADFIAAGAYARHISRMTRLYRQRRSRLVESLYEHFGSEVRISGAAAGLHVLVTLLGARGGGEAVDVVEERIVRGAAARGVRVYPASGYFLQEPPGEPSFLMGYSPLRAAQITQGVAMLAEAVREAKTGRP